MADTLNRTEIRAALASYLLAKRQHSAILADAEIQTYFAAESDAEAQRLIDLRYPLGRSKTVHDAGILLIEAMYRKAPVTVDPELMWRHLTEFTKLVALAREI